VRAPRRQCSRSQRTGSTIVIQRCRRHGRVLRATGMRTWLPRGGAAQSRTDKAAHPTDRLGRPAPAQPRLVTYSRRLPRALQRSALGPPPLPPAFHSGWPAVRECLVRRAFAPWRHQRAPRRWGRHTGMATRPTLSRSPVPTGKRRSPQQRRQVRHPFEDTRRLFALHFFWTNSAHSAE
jgi:hypothetical protein